MPVGISTSQARAATDSMAKVDADRFVELIRLSRTVDEPDIEKALESADDDVRLSSENLAQHFIAAGLLTRWQCDNLLDGKHKGFRLGNYRLMRKLGRGGMSTVYLARHALMKREAAIKVLPRRRVEDSSYLARFHREAQAAAALDHPNIVRIYDVDADGNTHFIAMEFIDGQDLQTRVASDGRLDCDLAADYIAQSALGLQHAHDIGLIHRDIKPANLLANEKNVIKILDMGLAKFDEDEDAASLTKDHNENVLGTVDYLSPEQARDSHAVDHRADIYSLGCTLYFLLAGNAPFPEGSLAQRILKHQQSKPTPLLEKREDIPPELVVICNRMMEKDPNKRPQSSTEVAELLTDYLASRGKSVTGAGDSGAGSRIGLAASVVRELTESQTPEEDPNDVDTLIATVVDPDTTPGSGEKDTKISRSQDETRKSVPKLIPDDEGQSTRPQKKPAKEPEPEEELQLVTESREDAKSSGDKQVARKSSFDDLPDVDLGDLESELGKMTSGDDHLLHAPVRVGTRLQSREEPSGIPTSVWITGGVVVLVIVVFAIAVAVL